MNRLAPRPRVSASIGAALGALALACAAPSAIAAEPPPPPPPAGLDLQLGEILRITLNPNAVPGQLNLPIGIHLNVPSVLELRVDTGLGVTTPPDPGLNLGVQVPVAVDLSSPLLGNVALDVNANVDASLLNGQDVVAAAATVDVNAEASLLGLETELGANVAANVVVGPNPVVDVQTDLRLPPDLARIIEPAGTPSPKPLPVVNQTATPPVVQQPPPPPVDPTPVVPTPNPPTLGPEPTPPVIDPTPPAPPVPVPTVVAEVPVVEVPVLEPSAPPLERLRDVAVAAGRSIWLPLGLMLALFAYLLGQRVLDGGAKLASASRSATPDDEIIEL